ncbi:quinone oxidoreductase [Mucilaginibacter sp. PAMB04168]|uniref:quinone oxidoreductase family protein n=1 Tax=Mucilaginibacter sp. PAMB04168 TaxID=3138567 RepID=UPI0031F640B6
MKTDNETGVVLIDRQGAPSVLTYTTTNVSEPKGNELLIEHKAISLNFVDVLFRNGSFPLNTFPATIGVEAAGVVKTIGDNVTNFTVGDRIAYFFSLGAYAERRLISANDLIKLPEDVSFDQAASILAKGLTARMLIKQAYLVKSGDVILVHAAAGGVGSLVSRWAKALGATVIGTVGHTSKKAVAISQGIDYVVALDTEDLESIVRSVTHNQGVQAVYDGVGKATFGRSVKLTKRGGSIILYGTASGEPEINTLDLKAREVNLTRPSLGDYLPNKNSVELATSELFQALRNGVLGEIKPTIYPLAQAAQAHQDLELGQTTGSIIFHV